MKSIIAFLLSSTILLVALQGIAQSTIEIVDIETLKPIPYAHLSFESIQTKKKSYSITSLEGKSDNSVSEKSIIVISFTGYKTVLDTILPGEDKKYKLSTDLMNLDQVVVTATRTSKKLKDVPVITQLLLAEEIESRGITEIGSLLEDEVPGVEIHQAGYGADIKIQGLDANYVLFLIDGERMAGETEGNVDYSRINMNDVERVEIVKGASSALYGSQAMGGVINIITKKPNNKVEFSLGGKYGEMNQTSYPDLKSNDDFYFYKSKLDLPNLNLHGTLGFNLNKFMSKTNFNIKSSDAYILTSSDSLHKDYVDHDLKGVELPTMHIPGNEDYSISQLFEYQVTDKWRMRANANYYKHNIYDFKKDNIYDGYEDFNFGLKSIFSFSELSNLELSYNDDTYHKYEVNERIDWKNKLYNHHFYNPKAILNQRINEQHFLTVGLEDLAEELATMMFSSAIDSLVSKSSNTIIAYAQDDYQINSKWNMIGGFRMDHHSTYGTHLTPKLSMMYKLIPVTFRANYAMGFRSPTLKELYMDWSMLGMFDIKGNENLIPETNNYLSFSAEYTRSVFNISANFYQNWFKNKIGGYWSFDEYGKQVYNYTNIDKSQMHGLEVLFKYNIKRNFFISGGYSYIKDSQEMNNKSISAISPHSGNIRFEYTLTKRIYQLKVNLTGKFTGAKDYYELDDIEVNGQQEVGSYLAHYDPFSMWKFTISQSFHNGIYLVIGVDNIFDYKAPIVSNNSSLSPGRRGYISLNLKVDHLYREFRSLIQK
ncbi:MULTISPECIES: TonB-dependent receptor [unclassified Lentimicrobium]|uniref:TonB-dependent receptor n=1 Tax=unclassified Lentimicrobium TaxID=2677434 RepID=UPI00155442A1|nr:MULTISPECIES: TonB-dependent receptor [unclassified Lentimicrobium]NPD44080.1 TonB-dependent receptor [Lentimicrobium sp. S6]NPD86737.1 TonB-dependent receptor [Lentimicrobium sp. L6]